VQKISLVPDRFELLFDKIPVPMMLVDDRGALVRINLAGAEALMLPGGIGEGTPFPSLCLERWSDDFLANCIGSGRVVRERFSVVRSGAQLWFECEGQRFEEQVLVHFHELDEADAAQLSQKVEELSQESHAKDEFLAMLGHELRNPLAPMLTALELMDLKDHYLFQRERQVLTRQTRHLSRLVDDLLDVSRIVHGRISINAERLDLKQVLDESLETVAPLYEGKKHTLTVDAPLGLWVHGDLDRLTQVFTNLLINAARYTDRGGKISLTVRREGATLCCSVKDNGVGMSSELLPQVFDPFVREKHSGLNARSGLGLGLTIVRAVVSLHGGSVEAHSDGIGKGSKVIVRLPALAEDAVPAPAAAAPITSRFSRSNERKRVLIVDDNTDAADMLKESLEGAGFLVRAAYDGPEALRAVREFTPDIALLDIGLPAMSGYELAGRLRSTPGLDTVRLIALTGFGQERDRAEASHAGFQAHLVKPIDLAKLIALLDLHPLPPRNP
jgi:signal transduction histidine kinase/CheY-like chemotaxis protein